VAGGEPSQIETRVASRVDRTIEREAMAGLRHATWARAIALAALGGWLLYFVHFPQIYYYLGILLLFVVIGFAYRIAGEAYPSQDWVGYVFITLDVFLLTFALLYPNPLETAPWPPQVALRLGNFPYFYIFLAGTLLTYSPRQVVWAGVAIAAVWSGAIAYVVYLPDTLTFADYPEWSEMSTSRRLEAYLFPYFVDVQAASKDAFVVLVVTGILASVVWRMRRLAFRQADVERQRTNLARYFSPSLIDELSREQSVIGKDTVQDTAVMFLDIRGFTAFAEQLLPETTLELLRSFHRRMSQEVFAHGGTLDKFIGDGLMATFGVPRKGPNDATNAVLCALAMRQSMQEWNAERERQGWQPIQIGVGIHYGPVVMGNIGTEERLEFAVIGDTVNVASRIEHLSRELHTEIVLSDDVMAAAHGEIGLNHPIFDGFREAPEQHLRGRLTGMICWVYSEEVAEEDRQRRVESIDLAPASD
jgi:adenylate cyclase